MAHSGRKSSPRWTIYLIFFILNSRIFITEGSNYSKLWMLRSLTWNLKRSVVNTHCEYLYPWVCAIHFNYVLSALRVPSSSYSLTSWWHVMTRGLKEWSELIYSFVLGHMHGMCLASEPLYCKWRFVGYRLLCHIYSIT